jgi:hypothetical protein
MAITQPRSHRRTRRIEAVHKPAGTFHSRVTAVGVEHFGVVSIDCAKARCKWMLADFLGKVLVAPAEERVFDGPYYY